MYSFLPFVDLVYPIGSYKATTICPSCPTLFAARQGDAHMPYLEQFEQPHFTRDWEMYCGSEKSQAACAEPS
jgi:hypothetical protein